MKIYNINSINDRIDLFNKTKDIEDLEPIVETEQNISGYSAIKIDDNYYSVCSTTYENGQPIYSIVEKFEVSDDFDDECFREDYIKCPVCGWENLDSFECSDYNENYICGQCGSVLSYGREIEVTYTTKLVKKVEPLTILRGGNK